MDILVIGGAGTVGKCVSDALSQKHKVLVAGRQSGDVQVDMTDAGSILSMFEHIGSVDAIVSIAGEAKWASFEDLTEEDYYVGLRSKLMGHVNVVRIGQQFLRQDGSFTLTTGILADDPVLMTASASMVNGGIHSFVQAVALEMKKGHRINAVSCGLVEDSLEKYEDYFPGHNPIPMSKVANAYKKSVLGKMNGQIIRVYE